MSPQSEIHRRGFTLLELIVSITVVGMLTSLILVAIGQARAASRRMICTNHIRQVAIGVHNYHAAHRVLPTNHFPYKNLLGTLNVSADQTATPAFFSCPDDEALSLALGQISYRFNEGFANRLLGKNGVTPKHWGTGDEFVRFRDITDGLSQTAMIGEKLVEETDLNVESGRLRPHRVAWLHPVSTVNANSVQELMLRHDTIKHQMQQCVPHIYFGGQLFLTQQNGYNHALPPMSLSFHFLDANGNVSFDDSIVTLTSRHAGGTVLARMDGSVGLVSPAIDRKVWAELGTRNGL